MVEYVYIRVPSARFKMATSRAGTKLRSLHSENPLHYCVQFQNFKAQSRFYLSTYNSESGRRPLTKLDIRKVRGVRKVRGACVNSLDCPTSG